MPPLGDFSETVARPLFLPSRRPLAPAEDAPAEAGVVRNLFTLMGVIISADERVALVKRRKTGEVLRLIEGQRVDGWLVEAIMPDRLALNAGTFRADQRRVARAGYIRRQSNVVKVEAGAL